MDSGSGITTTQTPKNIVTRTNRICSHGCMISVKHLRYGRRTNPTITSAKVKRGRIVYSCGIDQQRMVTLMMSIVTKRKDMCVNFQKNAVALEYIRTMPTSDSTVNTPTNAICACTV
uniref:Uncharacterized protein LOC102809272 n=1 Tax=Saccoglossus kowalevskii TaxID=10224 RepID=A0ABM0MIM7_SACKO|nr:PREDICTED: uncharacterized protein LOC102809272 [Saccoglossus kowalevskii]